MTKKEELNDLKKKMQDDKSLPLRQRATNLVFGVGIPESKVLCIGEGPGYYEDQKGEPFVGNAGKLLDQLLQLINLSRGENVYITNVVHHRPPENRDPSPAEIAAYSPYLNKIIGIIKPKVIITLGRFSMGKFLPNAKISAVHGKVQHINWKGTEIMVVPMYHPAAALRNAVVMSQIREDFQKFREILKELNSQKLQQLELI